MNLFRCTPNGALDRKFLRVCIVYRLLKKKIIGQARAIELMAEKHSTAEMKTLKATVELWRANSLKDMLS